MKITCSHGVVGKVSCRECRWESRRARRLTEKYQQHKLSPQFKARRAIENGIQKGTIIKPDRCQLCWEKRNPIHGHHQDYSKKREVVWLCSSCHSFIHGARYQGFTTPSSPGAPQTPLDAVQGALIGIRDIVKGRCDILDLEMIREIIDVATGQKGGSCKCKAQRTAVEPQVCDWPMCGCDPYADKVIEALQESGRLIDPSSPGADTEQK